MELFMIGGLVVAYWLPRVLLGSFILLLLLCVAIDDYITMKKRNFKLEKKCKRKDKEIANYKGLFEMVRKW